MFPLSRRFDVVDTIDLVHEQALRLHDDRDRLEGTHILEPHGNGASNRFTHHHIDLRLPREQPQNLPNLVPLKLAHADTAALNRAVRLRSRRWGRASRFRGRCCRCGRRLHK